MVATEVSFICDIALQPSPQGNSHPCLSSPDPLPATQTHVSDSLGHLSPKVPLTSRVNISPCNPEPQLDHLPSSICTEHMSETMGVFPL